MRYKYAAMLKFHVRRDFAALRFIRVSCELPGVKYGAAGAGFSLPTAIAKCRSERIERSFELLELLPKGVVPSGIAAHPAADKALRAAYMEATEHFLTDAFCKSKVVSGHSLINTQKFKWWIMRVPQCGWFSVISTKIKDKEFVACSARSTRLGALLKVWEEYRSPISAKVSSIGLSKYTRAMQRLFPQDGKCLQFHSDGQRAIVPDLASYSIHNEFRENHHIVYLTKASPSNIQGRI